MPITETQRQRRRNHIGSSDSAPIMGLSPWAGPGDVWAEKVHEVDRPESEPMAFGNDFEVPLIRWCAGRAGLTVKLNQGRAWPEDRLFASSIDALDRAARVGIEAKTGGDLGYGEEGTDQVPEHVLIQCQHHMLVHDLDRVLVPLLTSGWRRPERRVYIVDRHEGLISEILRAGRAFWRFVETKTPPPGDQNLPGLETLKSVRRNPGAWVALDPEIVAAYESANANLRAAEAAQGLARQRLLAAMGDAVAATWQQDAEKPKALAFLEQAGGLDQKRLRIEAPEIWARFQKDPLLVLRQVNLTTARERCPETAAAERSAA